MSDEKRIYGKHLVNIENRAKISISGVMDVSSFDEENISAETTMGYLAVKGSNLHISKLNIDSGDLFIEGDIDSVVYTDLKSGKNNKSSFFSKMFKWRRSR